MDKANADILTEANRAGQANTISLSSPFLRALLETNFLRPSLPYLSQFLRQTPALLLSSPRTAHSFLNPARYSPLSSYHCLRSVKEVFTFASTSADVLALGGSAAAQEGSSGGGVSNINGELIGTITTSTTEGTTDTRKLDAITASYIRSAYARETGSALDLLLAKPTSTSIADFATPNPRA